MRRLLRLVAVLALLGAGTAVGVLPATAGTGGQPCVGVVVDARPLGGNVAARCSKGTPGRDSVQVLTDAGFRVRLSSTGSYAGFLCQLDSLPASSGDDDGCANDADAYRYWGFFVREPGAAGWTYSSKGVRGYKPVDGAQIGFRFETDRAETAPPVYAQDQVCPQAASPRPSPVPSRGGSAVPPAPAASRGAPRPTAAAASARPSAAPPRAVGSGRPASPAGSGSASGRALAPDLGAVSLPPLPASGGATASPVPGVLLPESGLPVPAGRDLGAGSTTGSGRSGSLGAALLGGALVLGLAGFAALRWRNRRG